MFQKSVNGGKTYFHVFRGATSKRLNHYILPILHEDHPEVVLLHIGSNDINNQTKNGINNEELMGDIINIVKSCIDIGVKEVVISILSKNNIALTRLIRKVNDSLREQCVLNGYGFTSNDKRYYFSSKLYKKERKKYYESLDMKNVLDSKKFWKTMGFFLSDKNTVFLQISIEKKSGIISWFYFV